MAMAKPHCTEINAAEFLVQLIRINYVKHEVGQFNNKSGIFSLKKKLLTNLSEKGVRHQTE